jgi:predicted DsbA family dithiol-disulfide isomerase
MVKLYSTGCPKCIILTKKLDSAGITYEVFDDVDKMIEMGMTTVPMLEVDGKIMNFKEAVDWIKKGK